MSNDNDNSFAGLGSVLSAFGEASNTTRDVESASVALREPSPPRSPPPARRSPSPPSFNYSRSDNTATYDYRPTQNYSTNYHSTPTYRTTSNAGSDCSEMAAVEILITFILGIAMFVFIVYATSLQRH